MSIRSYIVVAAAAGVAFVGCDAGSGGDEASSEAGIDQRPEHGVHLDGPQPVEPGYLVASVAEVTLDDVSYGEWTMDRIALHNPGPGDARLERVAVDGPAGLHVEVMGQVARRGQAAVFATPHRLRSGDEMMVEIVAQPDARGAWDATVRFEGAGAEPVEVAVSGEVKLDAITPVVSVAEGTRVSMPATGPLDVHLSAARSASPDGAVTGWEWRMKASEGGEAELLPNRWVATPTLRITEPGRFDVQLSVVDDTGAHSPLSKKVPIVALDDSALRVHVEWDGRTGADLDVHLVHPSGASGGQDVDGDGTGDGWFDPDWDAWEDNPQPIWTTDSPGVLTAPIVSSDGDGLDSVTLPATVSQGTYAVGVHAVEVPEAEAVSARVVVRVAGEIVWTSDSVALRQGDLWDVGAVGVAEPRFTPADSTGAERVLPSVTIP